MMKIHSRFIARPLNRFTHVESFQPGFQVLSNGHESIQFTRFNGFKFNRRRPLETREPVKLTYWTCAGLQKEFLVCANLHLMLRNTLSCMMCGVDF